jgi:type IV pilus assembly protein PilA
MKGKTLLKTIKQRLGRDDEQGFTLIELMVVVLIIAILLAIAIPTFLGAKGSANARGAQSSLRNGLTAEQTYWTSSQAFGDGASTPSIGSIEPNLTWTTGNLAAEDGNTVSVTLLTNSNADDTVVLQAYAKDGNCYAIEQTNDPTVDPTKTVAMTGYSVSKGACKAPAGTTTFTNVKAGPASKGSGVATDYYQTF